MKLPGTKLLDDCGFARTPLILTLLLALLGAVASPAAAMSTTISFDFSGSQVTILGGVISVPPDGSIDPRITKIQLPGTPDAILDGAASLEDYGLSLEVDALVQGQAQVQGPAGVSQSGIAAGSLMLSGSDGMLSFPSVLLDVFASITCSPLVLGACDGIGDISEGPSQSTLQVDLVIADIGVIGGASIQQQLQVVLGGVTADVTLIGQEVSRVPEPASLALVGLGLVAACASGRRPLG